MQTDEEMDIVEAMDRFGGSFVKSLAQCFQHADRDNFIKLQNAFPEYWDEYAEKVKNL